MMFDRKQYQEMEAAPQAKIEQPEIDATNLFSPLEIFDKYPPVPVKVEVTNDNFQRVVWHKTFPNLALQSTINETLPNFQIGNRVVKQKYKRSTNNSHKKFISSARKLLFSNLNEQNKLNFQNHYGKYKSCRSYFFIVLAYVRYKLQPQQIEKFAKDFQADMSWKIKEYQRQIDKTPDQNLKNFRSDEISDIQCSIEGCKSYLFQSTEKGIEWMYKRSRSDVIKKQHYNGALRMIHNIEKKIAEDIEGDLQIPIDQDNDDDQLDQSENYKIDQQNEGNQRRQQEIASIVSPFVITGKNRGRGSPLFAVDPLFCLKKKMIW